MTKQTSQSGFTFLIAMIVMGTLLLVSTGVVNLAVKQSLISNSGRESQLAFYAADTGLECALYWDVKNIAGDMSAFSTTTTSTVTCNRDVNNPGNEWIVGGASVSTMDTITFLPEPYCAKVTVTKNANGITQIESLGYNTCDPGNSRRVERAVRATYGVEIPPYATPAYAYPTPVVTVEVDYLVVGGGGGGGNGPVGGGGGGGDVLVGSTEVDDNIPVSIVVGNGGAPNSAGGPSDFGAIRAVGGGAGATSGVGGSGANGGGGGRSSAGGTGSAGFSGGAGGNGQNGDGTGGGGGGDTASGSNGDGAVGYNGGAGGAGRSNNYSGGAPTVYGSGGGGASGAYTSGAPGGDGAGGGGVADFKNGGSGVTNRGGGGGGASVNYVTAPLGNGTGGSGGSGIVIIRYRSNEHSGATGGSISTQGPYTVHTFTSSGTFTP